MQRTLHIRCLLPVCFSFLLSFFLSSFLRASRIPSPSWMWSLVFQLVKKSTIQSKDLTQNKCCNVQVSDTGTAAKTEELCLLRIKSYSKYILSFSSFQPLFFIINTFASNLRFIPFSATFTEHQYDALIARYMMQYICTLLSLLICYTFAVKRMLVMTAINMFCKDVVMFTANHITARLSDA